MKPVRVKMLQDDKGYSAHEGQPRLVEASSGAEVIVSSDLATLWAARGACKVLGQEAAERRTMETEIKRLKAAQSEHAKKVAHAKKIQAMRVKETEDRRQAIKKKAETRPKATAKKK